MRDDGVFQSLKRTAQLSCEAGSPMFTATLETQKRDRFKSLLTDESYAPSVGHDRFSAATRSTFRLPADELHVKNLTAESGGNC